MKLAVSGKGGVGKTTLSAMLAGALALRGQSVIAIDADPDSNLACALGVPADEQMTPLATMSGLIQERTGSKDDYGGFFKLNPKVDDIPDKYCRRIGNIRLLVLGGISRGGDGCLCPATALLRALLIHVVLGRDEALVIDMEAGIEHLGRATAQSMDALVVVADRSAWSTQTALRVQELAGDLGLQKIFAVANRVSESAEIDRIAGELGDIPLIGHLPTDDRLAGPVVSATAAGQLQPSEALADNLPAVQQVLDELTSRT